MNPKQLEQISNYVYCDSFLNTLDIETKLLPNPYHDYPFLVIKDFFSKEICDEIVNSKIKDNDAIDAKVKSENYENHIDKKIRKTKIYKLDKKYRTLYDKMFKLHQSKIEQYFNIALTTSTKIQVLEYKKDSFYIAHSDDSNMIMDNDKLVGFKCVVPNRKLTSVLFSTSYDDNSSFNTFSGGELVFNYLYDKNGNQIKFKPEAGDMVLFLSNPYFTHEVLKVKEGYRLSIVQWHDALVV
ncbi:2OG-Fe(II) oxygenase [Campylobacterota bacterium DY0563]